MYLIIVDRYPAAGNCHQDFQFIVEYRKIELNSLQLKQKYIEKINTENLFKMV